MEYKIGDQELSAAAFIGFCNKVWPGRYNEEKTAAALSKTLNITAYDGETLVGRLRILTDGYFFGTITEMLVLPDYQRQGIGSRLLQLARENTPTMLYFGRNRTQRFFTRKTDVQKAFSPILYRKSACKLPVLRNACSIQTWRLPFQWRENNAGIKKAVCG